jgi:hypothetical protein
MKYLKELVSKDQTTKCFDVVSPEREEYEYRVWADSDGVKDEKVAVPKSGERGPDLDPSDE